MFDIPRSSLNHLVERLYAKKGEESRARHLSAVMGALGYREVERDSLRGMAALKYTKIGAQ